MFAIKEVRNSVVAVAVGAGLVLGGGAAIGALKPPVTVETQTVMESAPFNEEAVRAFKISGLTYNYTNFIYREDVRTLNIGKLTTANIPGTKTQIGVSYDGKMEIGVDASAMKINQQGQKVTITLPKPQILSHEEVRGTMKVVFDNSNLFNDNSVAEFVELFDSEKTAMEQRAVDRGFLLEAGDSAAQQLEDFINSLPGMDEYNVVVRTA
jgi:hypothetical protein